MKQLNNQSGFGILEVLIASSLLTIVALGSASIVTGMNKSQTTASVNSSILGLVSQARNAITNSNAAVCNQTLSGEISVVNPLNPAQVIVTKGMAFDNNAWTVSSVTFANQTTFNGVTKGTVTLTISRDGKRTYGGSVVTRMVTDAYCGTPTPPPSSLPSSNPSPAPSSNPSSLPSQGPSVTPSPSPTGISGNPPCGGHGDDRHEDGGHEDDDRHDDDRNDRHGGR